MLQGEDMVIPTSMEIPRIFGRDETGYYALGRDHRYYLEHFDHNFRSTELHYLTLNKLAQQRDLEAVFYFHDKIYVFSSQQRFRKMVLYVQTVDKTSLRQFDDEQVVMEIEHLKGWFTDFHFHISRKEEKLLVYSQLDALSRNIQDLYFRMYGENLELEWEQSERIAYDRRPPRESSVKVDDEGNVFIISLLDQQNLLSLFRETKNRYLLVALTDSGRTVNKYPIDYPDLYIRGVQVEPGRDHDASVVGFYSPSHFNTHIDGIFYFEVNNRENRIENQRFHEIERHFLSEVMNLDRERDPEEMFSFDLRHLILREDGTMIMLAENNYYEQNFDNVLNIMAAGFSPGGELKWKMVIPKRQSYDPRDGYNYTSYGLHAPWYGNRVDLVFNDNPMNGDWPSGEKIYGFNPNNKAILKTVGIGTSGELTTAVIYHKKRRRMKTPIPLSFYDPLDDDMVIPAMRYRKLSFFRISF